MVAELRVRNPARPGTSVAGWWTTRRDSPDHAERPAPSRERAAVPVEPGRVAVAAVSRARAPRRAVTSRAPAPDAIPGPGSRSSFSRSPRRLFTAPRVQDRHESPRGLGRAPARRYAMTIRPDYTHVSAQDQIASAENEGDAPKGESLAYGSKHQASGRVLIVRILNGKHSATDGPFAE